MVALRVSLSVWAGFALLLASVASLRTHAQTPWKPAKPVELVAPSAAGGGTDTMARLMQRILQERRLLDVAVTVVNKPGGSGSIALAYLQQHAGDAHYVAA